jgi:hypothetical protein
MEENRRTVPAATTAQNPVGAVNKPAAVAFQ